MAEIARARNAVCSLPSHIEDLERELENLAATIETERVAPDQAIELHADRHGADAERVRQALDEDARIRGEQSVEKPAHLLVDHLGSVRDEPVARERWVAATGRVAQHRALWDLPKPPSSARPSASPTTRSPSTLPTERPPTSLTPWVFCSRPRGAQRRGFRCSSCGHRAWVSSVVALDLAHQSTAGPSPAELSSSSRYRQAAPPTLLHLALGGSLRPDWLRRTVWPHEWSVRNGAEMPYHRTNVRERRIACRSPDSSLSSRTR
jgi:hypothetical protein